MTEEELVQREGLQRRAEARDLVTSWFLALWALFSGLYLTLGGAKHLVSPAYSFLMPLFRNDYRMVGAVLLVLAVANMIAVSTGSPWGLAAASFLIGSYLFVIAACMGYATFGVPDGGNLNWVTAIGLGGCYYIRAYNKVHPPSVSNITAAFSLAAMWFV